jgi:acyl-CoA hydrolase
MATIWKTLTDLSGNPVYVNVDNVAFITPITGGSRITFTGPVSEGHPVSVSVNAAPTTILSGETVS